MNVQVVEGAINRNDDTSTMDIYDLSWYTLYLMEVYGKPSITNNIIDISSILRTFVEENEELLYMVLYDKELIVGILLGYYILLKSRFYDERDAKPGLSKVLEAVKSYIDEYSTYGEVLYVLKKLDTVTYMIGKFIDIDRRIRILFDDLKDMLLKGHLRIEHAEDLSYVIWLLCENKAFDIVAEKDLTKAVLDDRLYNLASMDHKSTAVYANALANFILKCKPNYGREVHSVLHERSEEIYKTLEFYIKALSQTSEDISKALTCKIELGIHNLSKALQKLRGLNEVQKVKRKYRILSAVSVLLIMVIVAFPEITYMLQNMIIHVRLLIVAVLTSLFFYIIDDLFENKAFKWLLEVLKSVVRAFISHS